MNTGNGCTERFTGNPLMPGIGLCDALVRVFGGRAWLYATHDASPDNTFFCMHDWWIWSSDNLHEWRQECIVRPEHTYWKQPCTSCWAVGAAERAGTYFLYVSRGPKEIGVLTAPTPAGPWSDPLGAPLIPDGLVPVDARSGYCGG